MTNSEQVRREVHALRHAFSEGVAWRIGVDILAKAGYDTCKKVGEEMRRRYPLSVTNEVAATDLGGHDVAYREVSGELQYNFKPLNVWRPLPHIVGWASLTNSELRAIAAVRERPVIEE